MRKYLVAVLAVLGLAASMPAAKADFGVRVGMLTCDVEGGAGLIVGLSPGFRVAPPEAVPDAEETVEENPSEGKALIRIIKAAVLFELSAVTRPAYDQASLAEARHWASKPVLHRPAALRWRA